MEFKRLCLQTIVGIYIIKSAEYVLFILRRALFRPSVDHMKKGNIYYLFIYYTLFTSTLYYDYVMT